MATYSKRILSESVDGLPILVDCTDTLGTIIHTTEYGTTSMDEIWLWAVNISDDDVQLTIEWGDAGSNIIGTIPAKSGLYTLVPGLLLQNGSLVTAFASNTNVIYVHGFVNRITA